MTTQRVKVFSPMANVGPVYLQDLSVVDGPRYHIGNTGDLKVTHNENVEKIPDYDNIGGGTHAELRRIESVGVAFVLYDINADNIALATRGTRTTVASGTVTDEAKKAHIGGLVRLDHPGASSVVVTSADGQTTYTGYDVKGAGVLITADGDLATAIAALPDPTVGLPVLVSYGYGEYHKVQPLTEAAKQFALLFDGFNEADSGKPVIVDIHKVSPGIVNELALKSTSMMSVPIEGEVLKDTSKGAGESAFYEVNQVA
ncbi:MAG: hypothetical protein COW58_13870 [Thalassolituus sp. CG17_big_fil_post_rev_8_21_14_2_50_53_8]|nr:MAG: hypothetical protein COW58_13870 [Thalassolituus sp. CG17_big_fil_post_rev_8_21_14_2_50_53_8]